MRTNPVANVHEDALPTVLKDDNATRFAQSVDGLFRISVAKRVRKDSTTYTTMYLKPSNAISSALLITQEILGLSAPFRDSQFRTITAAKKMIAVPFFMIVSLCL